MHYCPSCKMGTADARSFQWVVGEGFSGPSHVKCECGHEFTIQPRVIVTRHTGLVEYLYEIGMLCRGVDIVIQHATPEEISGRHVFGVLPLHLAVHAWSITEIPLSLSQEDRGQELSVDRVREIAGSPQTYYVFQREQLEEMFDSIL